MNGHATAGAGAPSTDTPNQQLWARYEETKHNDQVKNALLEDVLTRYDLLCRKHQKYIEEHQQDHDAARESWDTATYWHENALRLQRLLNDSPFIVALIDADHLIFHASLLRECETGGRKAALHLQNAIIEWATREVVECPQHIKIVVRAFGNVKRLGDACTQAGLIPNPAFMEAFARGLTLALPSFDFVDTGPAPTIGQSKVIDNFHLYIKDYHCRQVLLGCGNSSAYTKLLEQYSSDAELHPRFTVIEGAPLDKEIMALPVQVKKFPTVFHADKVAIPGQMSSPRDRVDTPGMPLNATSNVFTPRTGSADSRAGAASPMPLRPGGAPTWAAITTKNAHKPLIDIPRSTPEPANLVKRNKRGQRLDVELEFDYDEVQRVKRMKACNQHFIGAGCCHFNAGRKDKCPHNHDVKFTQQDLKWLRAVARETPCKRGHECSDPLCIYGHHCPFPVATEGTMRGDGCLNGDLCRFPRSMHNMDTVPMKMTRVVGAFGAGL